MERQNFICRKAFAFRVPPAGPAGHKAADWNKDAIWSGQLRVVSAGGKCHVLLEKDDGSLFVKAHVTSLKTVEPVVDSSRYFVMRVDDGKGHHALIGLGFNNRDEAFDFKVSLQDWDNRVNGEAQAAKKMQDLGPTQDFSLGEGQTIKVNIKKKVKKKGKASKVDASGFDLMAPPPTKGARTAKTKTKKKKSGQAANPSAPPQQGTDFLAEFANMTVQQEPKADKDPFADDDAWASFD